LNNPEVITWGRASYLVPPHRVPTVNRRDFILLKSDRGGRSVELSCEQLYMRYHDSHLDGSSRRLFERLENELKDIDELRLVDSAWLAGEGLGEQLEPLLDSLRARGGRVEFVRTPTPGRVVGSY